MKEVAAEQQNIRLCTMHHSLGVHGTAYAWCAPRQPRIRAARQRRANFRSRAQRPKHVHTLAAVAFVRTSSTARKLSSRRGSYSAFCSGCVSKRERRLSHPREPAAAQRREGAAAVLRGRPARTSAKPRWLSVDINTRNVLASGGAGAVHPALSCAAIAANASKFSGFRAQSSDPILFGEDHQILVLCLVFAVVGQPRGRTQGGQNPNVKVYKQEAERKHEAGGGARGDK